MIRAMRDIFAISDIRRKIMFTLLMLFVYRIGSFVPVPNINVSVLEEFGKQNNIFGFMNTFSGGALKNFSIFAMGIMPYITASIIMQLLAMDVVPKFTQWSKEGEEGRRKTAQLTRYMTIVLGFIQAVGLSVGFNNMYPGLVKNPSWMTYAFIALTLTAGTSFLMWLGEQITEKGLGNGISIIICAGIIAAIPDGVKSIYASEIHQAGDGLFLHIVKLAVIFLVLILIVAGIVYVNQGIRKIPIQYAQRVSGGKTYAGQSTHLPIKVNAAGVIPVIFAVSLIMFPPTIANFWRGNPVADWVANNLVYTKPIGMILYVFLIIGFTYFYTFIQINPQQMADNMKKSGGFVPGVRPGKTTETFIIRILNRLTLAGAVFLALISVLPIFFTMVTKLPAQIQIGGTSILIIIGVCLDTMKQINAQMMKRHYRGFMD